VTVTFVNLQRGINKMIKSEILKLKHNDIFKKIYSKWRMRRFRDKTLTLEMIQRGALWEYGELMKQQNTQQTNDEDPNDYYVMVHGKSMLNSEWKKLMELQRVKADTSINPSPDWELQTVHYLQKMFQGDKEKPHKDRSVDLW